MRPGLIEGRACNPRRSGTIWQCDNWRTQEGEWFCGHCALPLPPVSIELEPSSGSLDSEDHAAREVTLLFDREAQHGYDELVDFIVEVRSSGPRAQRWSIPIALDLAGKKNGDPAAGFDRLGVSLTAWSRHILVLESAGKPVDLEVGLRHQDRSAAEPIAAGHFDYPAPSVGISGSPVILLHPSGDALRFAVSIAPASARVTACRLDIPDVALTLAGAVTGGESELLMEFPIDAQARRALEAFEQSGPATLKLAVKGVADEVPLELTLARAAALELQTQAEVRALTGRRARIGSKLKNGGGSAAIVERISWQLFDAARTCVAQGEFEENAGARVESDGDTLELRPSLVDEAGAPLATGHYRLELEVHYRDENAGPDNRLCAGASLTLDVRPDAPYRGLVCIDFGTTDTAAAILPDGRTYFEDPKSGYVPVPIALGRIAPFDPPESRYFIPTQVAVGLDAEGKATMLFADEAVESFGKLHRGRLVDRLKWQLGQGLGAGAPDEFKSIEELVAGYLDHVRRLIEEHPEVAARIEKVVATRPARFGALRERALISAFRRAGMQVDLTRFGAKARPMVSESWPPVLLMLPIREGPGKEPSKRLLAPLRAVEPRADFPEPLDLEALSKNPHYLCIFDIGGGSTDVSLLRLSIESGQIHVSDEWTYTDDHFAGEGIRDLIVGELRTAGRLALAGTGKAFSDDMHVLRRIATSLQFHPTGPFNRVSSTFFDFADKLSLNPEAAACLSGWLDDGVSMLAAARGENVSAPHPEAAALLSWLQADFKRRLQPSFGYVQRISLPLGGKRTLELSGDPLHDLMIRVFVSFYREFQPCVEEIYVELQHRLQGIAPDHVRMLMTGRGSAFALNEPLIHHVSAALQVESKSINRAPVGSAKAVTSWGALALFASHLTAKTLEFAGLSGGYALRATHPLTQARVGAVPLEPVQTGGGPLYGVPFHRIPPDFDPCMLTIGEDLGPRQEADVYVWLRDAGIEIGLDRSNRPAGGILFDPESGRVFSVADFSKPLIE